MTKEQILENITKEWKDSDVSPSRLASYLATIEERLEKIECSKELKTIIDNIHIQKHKPVQGAPEENEEPLTPEQQEVYDSLLCGPSRALPCEHKHRGLYGECLGSSTASY